MLRRRLLAAAPAFALAGCGVAARLPASGPAETSRRAPSSPVPGLSGAEWQWARTAWRYVENNTDGETGLVGGTDRSTVLTVRNAAEALAATLAAHALQIIDAREADLRLSRQLGFLATMDLSGGLLPNKAYNTVTGRMVGFDNRPADTGWSALDIGRLLLWLRIAGERHPRLREHADKVVLRWSLCDVIDDCGRLKGATRQAQGLATYEEGRLGEQQLAAAGYAAWGLETRESARLPPLGAMRVFGLPVHFDARDPRATGVQAPVTTMPYVLAGLEFGWQAPGGSRALEPLAAEVHAVQRERWRREHQVTARSDYLLAQAPWVVLDAVWAAGYPWNTIDHDGRHHERLALVSTRAAFGMWALWGGEYGDVLMDAVRHLYDPDRGWFEGRFEQGGAPHPLLSLPTNAAVLQTLWRRAEGRPLYAGDGPAGWFQVRTADPFQRLGRCWPGERPACGADR
jgi:hypothetical protein